MVRFLMLTRSGDWIWSKWSSSKPFLWNRQTVRGWRSLLIVCIPTCASTPTTSTYPCVSWTSSLPTLSTRMVISQSATILLIMYARLGGHSQFVNHPPLIIILSFNPWGIKLFTLPCITQFHPCISKLFNCYYPLSAEPLGRTPRMGGIRESTVENGVERLTLTQTVLLLNYAHSFSMLLFSSQNPS